VLDKLKNEATSEGEKAGKIDAGIPNKHFIVAAKLFRDGENLKL
jgi:hypothetical protein